MDVATTLYPVAHRYTRLDARAVADARLVLCDLDGCLIAQGRPFAETADFVAACGDRLWIVSNASDSTARRVFASAALIARAVELGIDPTADVPQAVLLCRDASVTVDTMGPILTQVGQGAPLWVSNEDLSHPGHDTRPVAETGALLAALRAIQPELEWRSLGKPDPMMLTMALTRSGVSAQDAVFVGDNVLTDGAAAAALNMPFVHIQRSIIQ